MNEATQCSSTLIAPAGRSRRSGIAHQVRAFIPFESSVSFTGRLGRRRPLTARGSATTMPSADSSSNTAARIAADSAPDCRVVPNPPARPDEASPGEGRVVPMHNPVVYLRQRTQRVAALCQLTHAGGLVCSSCSSAHGFPIAFLPTPPHGDAVGLR